jgi:hypothetical protein
MGQMEGWIAERLGFFVAWVLPFVVVFGAIWLGYWLKSPKIEKGELSDKEQSQKEITVEIRETLLRLHSVHSNMAEQIASSITTKQVKEAYLNLIALYQSQGKMLNLASGERDKETRGMLEEALNSLKLRSAYDANALAFISNMVWSMKSQFIKLESASDKTEYLGISGRIDKLRAKAPKYNKQINICVKYSYRLNCWYALTLWMQPQKDKLPPDLQIAVAQNKDLMDDFIHELIPKVIK